MIYLTQRRLMSESEDTIRERALTGAPSAQRVCRQLVETPDRYALWHTSHDRHMLNVAQRARRELQIVALRTVYIEQVHRAALVRYLRKHGVAGDARELTLRDFHGITDATRAAIAEHKTYLVAASSQICAYQLLRLVGDHRGVALIQDYQGSYGQYFGMFCENARSCRTGSSYILQGLLPDAKAEADALRARILGGEGLPSAAVAFRSAADGSVLRKKAASSY